MQCLVRSRVPARAIYKSSPLQTAFRSINVGAQHASIDFDTSGELYGREQLGLLGLAALGTQSSQRPSRTAETR